MRSTRPNNGGAGLIRSLERSARKKSVQFLMQHRMTQIHRESPASGRVVGITAIEVVRRGDVRRAKLYYLRGLRGKKARIAERGREDTRRERAAVPATGTPARAETEA